MPSISHPNPPAAAQRGVSLFISLVFLLILTVLGLAAARVALMQERMAGNVGEYNTAFQSAEATLREVELALRNLATGGTAGLPVIPTWADTELSRNDCTLQLKANQDWSAWDSAPWQTAPATGNGFLVVSITTVVEDAGGNIFQPPCLPVSAAGDTALDNAFIIAARATGPAGTADVIVQSLFYWP